MLAVPLAQNARRVVTIRAAPPASRYSTALARFSTNASKSVDFALPPRHTFKSYPPLITQHEVDTYLVPLYAAGWTITKTFGERTASKGANPDSFPTSQMTRTYGLKTFKSAIQFINDAAAICKDEKVCH